MSSPLRGKPKGNTTGSVQECLVRSKSGEVVGQAFLYVFGTNLGYIQSIDAISISGEPLAEGEYEFVPQGDMRLAVLPLVTVH